MQNQQTSLIGANILVIQLEIRKIREEEEVKNKENKREKAGKKK